MKQLEILQYARIGLETHIRILRKNEDALNATQLLNELESKLNEVNKKIDKIKNPNRK